MVRASLGEKNGVTSVILLPRKTVISLAAMSSLQGTIPCFITMTLTPLNRILTIIKDFELMKDPLHSMMRQKVGWQRNFAS